MDQCFPQLKCRRFHFLSWWNYWISMICSQYKFLASTSSAPSSPGCRWSALARCSSLSSPLTSRLVLSALPAVSCHCLWHCHCHCLCHLSFLAVSCHFCILCILCLFVANFNSFHGLTDGWTKNDLIYIWKDKGALQFAGGSFARLLSLLKIFHQGPAMYNVAK